MNKLIEGMKKLIEEYENECLRIKIPDRFTVRDPDPTNTYVTPRMVEKFFDEYLKTHYAKDDNFKIGDMVRCPAGIGKIEVIVGKILVIRIRDLFTYQYSMDVCLPEANETFPVMSLKKALETAEKLMKIHLEPKFKKDDWVECLFGTGRIEIAGEVYSQVLVDGMCWTCPTDSIRLSTPDEIKRATEIKVVRGMTLRRKSDGAVFRVWQENSRKWALDRLDECGEDLTYDMPTRETYEVVSGFYVRGTDA